jgi:hypothetical protein
MADKKIFINFDRDERVNENGGSDSSRIQLYYQEQPVWEINFIDTDAAQVDLSAVDTWKAACDDDFDQSTDPWVRVLNADIDSSQAANGIISVQLDANTSTFAAGIGVLRSKEIYFDLEGFDSSGKRIAYTQFIIRAKNIIDAAGGTPPDPVGNYPTWTEVYANFVQKLLSSVYNQVSSVVGTLEIYANNAGSPEWLSLDQIKAFVLGQPLPASFTAGVAFDIPLGDKDTYRAFNVFITLYDGTNNRVQNLTIIHDGSGGNVTQASMAYYPADIIVRPSEVTYAVVISASDVILRVTVPDVSGNAVYSITNQMPV